MLGTSFYEEQDYRTVSRIFLDKHSHNQQHKHLQDQQQNQCTNTSFNFSGRHEAVGLAADLLWWIDTAASLLHIVVLDARARRHVQQASGGGQQQGTSTAACSEVEPDEDGAQDDGTLGPSQRGVESLVALKGGCIRSRSNSRHSSRVVSPSSGVHRSELGFPPFPVPGWEGQLDLKHLVISFSGHGACLGVGCVPRLAQPKTLEATFCWATDTGTAFSVDITIHRKTPTGLQQQHELLGNILYTEPTVASVNLFDGNITANGFAVVECECSDSQVSAQVLLSCASASSSSSVSHAKRGGIVLLQFLQQTLPNRRKKRSSSLSRSQSEAETDSEADEVASQKRNNLKKNDDGERVRQHIWLTSGERETPPVKEEPQHRDDKYSWLGFSRKRTQAPSSEEPVPITPSVDCQHSVVGICCPEPESVVLLWSNRKLQWYSARAAGTVSSLTSTRGSGSNSSPPLPLRFTLTCQADVADWLLFSTDQSSMPLVITNGGNGDIVLSGYDSRLDCRPCAVVYHRDRSASYAQPYSQQPELSALVLVAVTHAPTVEACLISVSGSIQSCDSVNLSLIGSRTVPGATSGAGDDLCYMYFVWSTSEHPTAYIVTGASDRNNHQRQLRLTLGTQHQLTCLYNASACAAEGQHQPSFLLISSDSKHLSSDVFTTDGGSSVDIYTDVIKTMPHFNVSGGGKSSSLKRERSLNTSVTSQSSNASHTTASTPVPIRNRRDSTKGSQTSTQHSSPSQKSSTSIMSIVMPSSNFHDDDESCNGDPSSTIHHYLLDALSAFSEISGGVEYAELDVNTALPAEPFRNRVLHGNPDQSDADRRQTILSQMRAAAGAALAGSHSNPHILPYKSTFFPLGSSICRPTPLIPAHAQSVRDQTSALAAAFQLLHSTPDSLSLLRRILFAFVNVATFRSLCVSRVCLQQKDCSASNGALLCLQQQREFHMSEYDLWMGRLIAAAVAGGKAVDFTSSFTEELMRTAIKSVLLEGCDKPSAYRAETAPVSKRFVVNVTLQQLICRLTALHVLRFAWRTFRASQPVQTMTNCNHSDIEDLLESTVTCVLAAWRAAEALGPFIECVLPPAAPKTPKRIVQRLLLEGQGVSLLSSPDKNRLEVAVTQIAISSLLPPILPTLAHVHAAEAFGAAWCGLAPMAAAHIKVAAYVARGTKRTLEAKAEYTGNFGNGMTLNREESHDLLRAVYQVMHGLHQFPSVAALTAFFSNGDLIKSVSLLSGGHGVLAGVQGSSSEPSWWMVPLLNRLSVSGAALPTANTTHRQRWHRFNCHAKPHETNADVRKAANVAAGIYAAAVFYCVAGIPGVSSGVGSTPLLTPRITNNMLSSTAAPEDFFLMDETVVSALQAISEGACQHLHRAAEAIRTSDDDDDIAVSAQLHRLRNIIGSALQQSLSCRVRSELSKGNLRVALQFLSQLAMWADSSCSGSATPMLQSSPSLQNLARSATIQSGADWGSVELDKSFDMGSVHAMASNACLTSCVKLLVQHVFNDGNPHMLLNVGIFSERIYRLILVEMYAMVRNPSRYSVGTNTNSGSAAIVTSASVLSMGGEKELLESKLTQRMARESQRVANALLLYGLLTRSGAYGDASRMAYNVAAIMRSSPQRTIQTFQHVHQLLCHAENVLCLVPRIPTPSVLPDDGDEDDDFSNDGNISRGSSDPLSHRNPFCPLLLPALKRRRLIAKAEAALVAAMSAVRPKPWHEVAIDDPAADFKAAKALINDLIKTSQWNVAHELAEACGVSPFIIDSSQTLKLLTRALHLSHGRELTETLGSSTVVTPMLTPASGRRTQLNAKEPSPSTTAACGSPASSLLSDDWKDFVKKLDQRSTASNGYRPLRVALTVAFDHPGYKLVPERLKRALRRKSPAALLIALFNSKFLSKTLMTEAVQLANDCLQVGKTQLEREQLHLPYLDGRALLPASLCDRTAVAVKHAQQGPAQSDPALSDACDVFNTLYTKK